MSLFKSKEWWSVNLNESESYDSQCLLVSIIGKDRYQSIFLGNHDGLLRIYGPISGMTEDGEVIGYKPSDLLTEILLPSPILQLGMGTLMSGCHNKNLVVLHPKQLTVYTLGRRESGTDIGDQIVLTAAYQHQLRHSAYSFVVGPFGGGRGRDFICVQSLDGTLFFYEQESFVFELSLPDFLLPSPFAYIERIDCFLFLNSSLIFDCYSYESLASASGSGGESTKKMLKHWSYNIGEGIVDVQVVIGNEGCVIVILGERNLFGIGDNGALILTKRLEFRPVAFHAYVTAESKKLVMLISTDNCLLNIYEGTSLKWAMKIDQIPVAVSRIVLSNLYGGVVLLSENGHLQCVYLGTHPSLYLLPPINQPELNVSETEAELKRLQTEIAERDNADPVEIDVVGVELTVNGNSTDDENRRFCNIFVEITNQTPINKIQVVFVVDPPLMTTVKSSTVSCCDKTMVETRAFLGEPGAVSNLNVYAFVSYINANGVPFVVERRGKLPSSLVLDKASPTKEAKHRITIVTNKPVCPLNELYEGLSDGNPNVVGLKYANSNMVVTILAAKTTQRYRLQSDAIEGISLVLFDLVERLRRHFQNSSDFRVNYDGALPNQAYFEVIEHYHGLLQRRRITSEKLSKRTCQYRTIQKKVLVNLKDVTPKPLSSLNSILNDTYQMIVDSVAENESIEAELQLTRYCLNSLNVLLVALMELMTIASSDLEYLKAIFAGNVYDSDEQGWLEAQMAAASFFLRTTFAKSSKDQQKPTDIVLDSISNVNKVLKTFSAVFERVTKGSHLLERSEFEHEKEVLMTVPGQNSERATETEVLPEGSRLADLDDAVPVDAVSSLQNRKEKRLIKQDREDSLGPIRPAAKDARAVPVDKEEFENSRRFDSIEEDAIWDVNLGQMRI